MNKRLFEAIKVITCPLVNKRSWFLSVGEECPYDLRCKYICEMKEQRLVPKPKEQK